MLGSGWTRLGRIAAMAMVVIFGMADAGMAETAASSPSDGRVYQFPEPRPDDTVVINSRGGQRIGVAFWPEAVMASSQDMPAIRAMSDDLRRQFARLIGKHRLEDLLSMEQKRALAAKLVIVANNELAAYDRKAGMAVAPGRVYVEDIIFKSFSMEAVK